MIRKLTFLLLVLAFSSCTITKRVHRPGYHIQWKKIERTQKAEKVNNKIETVNERSTHKDDLKLNLKDVEELGFHQDEPQISSSSPKIQDFHGENGINVSSDGQLTAVRSKTPSAPSQTSSQVDQVRSKQKLAPILWRTPPENLRKFGIAMMILGGALLFASLLVAVGAFSGSGSGAWLNFFLDLISISEWFWILFVIVIFLLVSYLLFLFVLYVLGGPVVGSIVGASLLAIGIFFYILGERRTYER